MDMNFSDFVHGLLGCGGPETDVELDGATYEKAVKSKPSVESAFDVTFRCVEIDGTMQAYADKTKEQIWQAYAEGKRMNARLVTYEDEHGTEYLSLMPAFGSFEGLDGTAEYSESFYTVSTGAESGGTVESITIKIIGSGCYPPLGTTVENGYIYPVGNFTISRGN